MIPVIPVVKDSPITMAATFYDQPVIYNHLLYKAVLYNPGTAIFCILWVINKEQINTAFLLN